MSKEAMRLALAYVQQSGFQVGVNEVIFALREALAEQPALEDQSSAISWLYWKIDSKSRCTGPFKTSSGDEAYGPDCIDQTPLIFTTPQPATEDSSAAQLAAQQESMKDVIKAAQGVLEWTELGHRPPARDQFEVGRMAMVRLHALADLHDTLSAHNIKENT